MKKSLFLTISFIGLILGMIMLPMTAVADLITPDTFSATLAVGESVTIEKTVTVESEPPVTAPVDVFFLADSTGSMYSEIAAVKAAMSSIMASTSGLGDVRYGVGEYRDAYDSFSYRLNTDITNNTATVQAGINAVNASGGGDWYEANMYALEKVAEDTTWTASSTRILVWFGDAPGHDPRLGSTEVSATTALQTANISVQAIDTGDLDYTGQATRIAAATDGAYYSGIDAGSIVSTIQDAIVAELEDYDTVDLDLSDAPDGVDVSYSGSYTGDWERDVDRDFTFTVTFEGVTPGTYDFEIGALVDGGLVATESDSITVGVVPEPNTMLLMGIGLMGVAGVCRKRKK